MFGDNPHDRKNVFPFGIRWSFEGGIGNDRGDILEKEDKYEVVFNLAGFTKDEINVEIDEASRLMVVSAENKEEKQREFRNNKVRRRVKLPRDAILDDMEIEATYNNGILSIDVPKRESEGETDGFQQIDVE